MVPVHTQTPNEPSLGADAYVLLGLALTPKLLIPNWLPVWVALPVPTVRGITGV